jgi:3-dehydroquinate synthase class II
VGAGDTILPVNTIDVGDEILTMVTSVRGRHFGAEVDEFVIEK